MKKTAALALAVALGACARHEERELTAWLKVEIVRPATGTSGVAVVGANEEVFHVKVGSGWTRLGSGHPTRYIVLGDRNKEYYEAGSQPAALVDLNDGTGVRIVRAGESALRPLRDVFGRAGELFVPASRTFLDFWDCRDPAPGTGCRDLQIHRHDATGALVQTFRLTVPDAYPECRLRTVQWYDSAETPYVDAACAPSSGEAQCLLLAPRPDGLLVRAVGRDRRASECSDFPGLGIAKNELARFEVMQ